MEKKKKQQTYQTKGNYAPHTTHKGKPCSYKSENIKECRVLVVVSFLNMVG
jgi:hypothetical protein